MGNCLAMLIKVAFCCNQHIVHVDDKVSTSNFFSEDRVHYCLKGGWGVSESEEHYSGLEESSVSFEGGFPLIAFFDADIIVSLADIKLGKPFLSDQLLDELFDEREGICVPDGDFIELAIVLYWSSFAIFLFDKEER